MKLFSTLTCLLVISFSSSLFAGSVYKWTDSDGVVHYGDKKPDNAEAKKMRIKAGKGTPPPVPSLQNDSSSSKEESSATDSKQAAADKKALEEACDSARKNLATMKTYSRIRVKNNDGEFRYLSEEEKMAKQAESEKFISEKCK